MTWPSCLHQSTLEYWQRFIATIFAEIWWFTKNIYQFRDHGALSCEFKIELRGVLWRQLFYTTSQHHSNNIPSVHSDNSTTAGQGVSTNQRPVIGLVIPLSQSEQASCGRRPSGGGWLHSYNTPQMCNPGKNQSVILWERWYHKQAFRYIKTKGEVILKIEGFVVKSKLRG